MTYKEYKIKKKSGKLRKIVSPSPELKRYQRSKLSFLTKAFKRNATSAGVGKCFHGFIPGFNCVTAATKHIGYETTIMFDLANFFDTVTPDHIDKVDSTILQDQDISKLFHKDGYAAQGFPTSPLIANIALIKVIAEIQHWLDAWLKGKSVITVYADDIQISTTVTDIHTITNIKRIVNEAVLHGGFLLNHNKTRVRFAKYGARRILGVNVYESSIQATRKTNRKVRAVQGSLRHSAEKAQVLGGLRAWQGCHLPKGKEDTFSL